MTDQLHLSITVEEANMIVGALGNLPYVQVHQLIHRMQSQLGPQLLEIERKNNPQENGKEKTGVI